MRLLLLKLGSKVSKQTTSSLTRGFDAYIKSFDYKDIKNSKLTLLEKFWSSDNHFGIIVTNIALMMLILFSELSILQLLPAFFLYYFGLIGFGLIRNKFYMQAEIVRIIKGDTYEGNNKDEISFDEALKELLERDEIDGFAFYIREVKEAETNLNNMTADLIRSQDG